MYTLQTALHWAAKKGRKDVTEILLNTGMDVNTKSVRVSLHPTLNFFVFLRWFCSTMREFVLSCSLTSLFSILFDLIILIWNYGYTVRRKEGKNLEYALLPFSAKNIVYVPQDRIILSLVYLYFSNHLLICFFFPVGNYVHLQKGVSTWLKACFSLNQL